MPHMDDVRNGRKQPPPGITGGHLAYSLYTRYLGRDQFPSWGDLTLAQRFHWESTARGTDLQRK